MVRNFVGLKFQINKKISMEDKVTTVKFKEVGILDVDIKDRDKEVEKTVFKLLQRKRPAR